MPKPLLFGDQDLSSDELAAAEEAIMRWDASYVPGYSEKKHENDRRTGRGEKHVELPRLQWIRVTDTGGGDVGMAEMVSWHMHGYQFATLEDLRSMGFDKPPTASIDAAGRIRRADSALAFVNEERAGINRRKQAAEQAVISGASHPYDIPEERQKRRFTQADYDRITQG